MRVSHLVSTLALAVISFSSSAQGDANQSLEQRLLDTHNVERQRVGFKPLIWDAKLASDAAAWAKHLAVTNSFDHAPQSAHGENLWMGSTSDYQPEEMVGAWVDERQFLRSGKFPNVSRTGNWADVGHYTQLIWYNTTKLGCAVATGHGSDFLVCRYDPPGNWNDTSIRIGDSALVEMDEG